MAVIALCFHTILLIASASAFKVGFYRNGNCAGEFLGSWVGGPDQGCNDWFSGQAEGVVISSTGPVDDETIVQFYTSGDCSPGTELSKANDGCIVVDNEAVGAYQSFRVVRSDSLDLFDFPPASKPRSLHLRRQDASADVAAPSSEATVFHGMTSSFAGVDYRWQQIEPGSFIGVLPEEWDDAVNTMNSVDNLVKRYASWNTTLETLEDRDLVRALCQTYASCRTRALRGAATVQDAATPIIEGAARAAQRAGLPVWEFLERHPYLQQINLNSIAGLLTSPIGSLIGIKMSGHFDKPSECSTVKDDLDALKSMVSSLGEQLKSMQTVTVNIHKDDPGDVVTAVTITVMTCGAGNPSDSCGTSTGYCNA